MSKCCKKIINCQFMTPKKLTNVNEMNLSELLSKYKYFFPL